MTLVTILVIAGFALYVMNEEERRRLLASLLRGLGVARQAAATARSRRSGPFDEALQSRTKWAIASCTIAILNAIVFAGILFGPGSFGDPATLANWGANYGPQTRNGEWWRLVSATFVHTGFFHVLVNTIAVVQVGWVLERLVGPFAFTAVYLTAGTIAGIVASSAAPMSMAAGGSAAVYGIYGLLVAAAFWGQWERSPFSIPLDVLRAIAPGAAVFILYNLFSTALAGAPEMTGLALGLASGLVLSRHVSRATPSPRLVAAALAATLVVAATSTLFLRGVADVRPEIERILALEDRTAAVYNRAVQQFRLGAMSAKSLAELIDRTIVPEVHAAHARLKTITGVPHEHRTLMVSADEYLRLREKSWRLRSEALHKSNMVTLRKADSAEHASLEAFGRLRPAQPDGGGKQP